MNPTALLLIQLLAALVRQVPPAPLCHTPWQWDGQNCFIQSKAAQDPIRDAADAARLAYWLALRRAYDADRPIYLYTPGRSHR